MRALCVAVGAGALAFALSGVGCGSSDCTETATCAAVGDGSAGGDVLGNDVTVEGSSSSSGSSSGADSGSGSGGDSGHPAGDSGTGSDSMVLPDVVFIDSATCPTGSVCIDPVPSGWSGPLIVSDQTGGPPTPTPPACPSSYSNDAFDGYLSPTSPSATCMCTCGSLTGVFCSTNSISLMVYSDPGCATQCGSVGLPYVGAGFCVGTGCSSPQSAIASQPPAQGGSCTATPTFTNPPSAWAETARACQPTAVSGGCSGSQVCVPSPPSPFSSKLCILQSGSLACPAGSYSQQKVFYTSTMDTRTCSPACTCTPPNGLVCTSGGASLYSADMGGVCGGTVTPLMADGACHPVSTSGNVYGQATANPVPPVGGSCTESSPQPTGSVTQSGPTTICCMP